MILRGKTAIVTGGSGGIGLTVAELLAKEGAKVFILARRRARLSTALKRLKNNGLTVEALLADVPDPIAVGRAFKKVGRVDILVNAAGIQAPIGPFVEDDIRVWARNIEVNLIGTAVACHTVLPGMIRRRKGAIINFSGGGATDSRPNFSAYASAKTAVVRFTEILADEVRPYGIRVNAIAPGAVNTAMLDEVLRAGRRAGKKEMQEARLRARQGGTPPEKAAALCLFLASDRSKGLNGRLISAVWDPWGKWRAQDIRTVMKGEKYTLRRMK